MKILVCLDGSSHSIPPVESLKQRDWTEGTIVKLVTMIESTEGRFFNMAAAQALFSHDQEKESAQRYLRETELYLSKALPQTKIETEILHGHPREGLLQIAESWHPDLIIVGSRGARATDPLLLGSVSQAVLEHAHCPVQVAKRGPSSGHDTINVLLPVDHSAFSKAAAEWLLEQTFCKPLRVRIVSAVPSMPGHYSSETDIHRAARILQEYEAMERSAMHVLNEWKQRVIMRFGPESASCEILYGDARDAILAAASSWNADLVVMGSHGHTGLTRFLLGSVSRGVSIHASCSVEIVHPRNKNAVNIVSSSVSESVK